MVAESGDLTVLAEPGVDLDEATMALPWAEELMADLRCDGAYFGYDDAAKTLHITRFRAGSYDFSWADSLLPGPSYAMVFDDEGGCTDEDPRRFALKMLDMPLTSPLLDRYHFMSHILAQLGLETVHPELLDLPVSAVIACEDTARIEHEESS